jgi:hypothetical protein
MLQPDAAGKVYPRFIHVILDDSIRRSKEALKFVLDSFKDIKAKGYDKTVAVIPKWKTNMIIFADKFRFQKYAEDENLTYWIKQL